MGGAKECLDTFCSYLHGSVHGFALDVFVVVNEGE